MPILDPAHDATALGQAMALLRAGELVGFPTETVYGLGADARNPLAVRRIFAAKGRPADHPLIVHLATPADPAQALEAWAVVDDRARRLARALWPGPLTLVLPRRAGVPDEVTGGLDTVGLRMPRHPVAQALLAAFGDGVAAPSANRFGQVSPTTAAHVQAELGAALLVLDGGPCAVGIESTIVDLSGPVPALLRPGAVTAEQIQAIVGPLGPAGTTRAPGTLPGHYAPHTSLRIAADPQAQARLLRAQGLRVAVLLATDPAEYARQLYAELRRLDAQGVDVLVAQPAAEDGLGRAINDRLSRAARGSADPGSADPSDLP